VLQEAKMKRLLLFELIFMIIAVAITNDAVAQWFAIPQMQNVAVTSFLVTSDSTLFVGGYFHSLYRSTDGGEAWVNAAGQIPVDTILSLTSAGRYIFAGTNDGVCRSSDNGGTWETANNGLAWGGGAINQFATVDTVLYAATGTGVYRSTDFGTSWIPANNGLATIRTYTVPVLGIVSTPYGLYATQDLLGGAYVMRPGESTWKSIGLKTHFLVASALAAFDTAIFAGAWDGVFMYSGKDTMLLPRGNGLPEYSDFLEFCFFASTDSVLFIHTGYIGGAIFATSDFGQLWTPIGSTVFGNNPVDALATNKKYLFAGTHGGVWRIPLADIATSVNGHRSQLPAQYVLNQNYPNPFNPSTVISYQLPVNTLVTLKVYDVLGRVVNTLIEEHQTAGTHSATFNASSLLSGVYFYRLTVGSFVETKKLMLLK
jgi:Secretion system C-terminal sorting domain